VEEESEVDVWPEVDPVWLGETLAPGFHVPSSATVRFADWNGYRLELEIALEDGRYRCSELHLYQREGGAEVTGEVLRALPVARVVREAVEQVVVLPVPDVTKRMDGRSPSDETLKSLAGIYALAAVAGYPPKQRVADTFGISTSAASRWIARAREKKYLLPDRPL
jgi:hypothetical protein